MKIIEDKKNQLILLYPKTTYQDKQQLIKDVKTFLLTNNKIYYFLQSGFYQIEIMTNHLAGIFIKIAHLEEFYEQEEINLQIMIKEQEESIGLELDEFSCEPYYLYQENIFIDCHNMSKKRFYQLIETARIVLEEEMKEVKQQGYHQKSSLISREQ